MKYRTWTWWWAVVLQPFQLPHYHCQLQIYQTSILKIITQDKEEQSSFRAAICQEFSGLARKITSSVKAQIYFLPPRIYQNHRNFSLFLVTLSWFLRNFYIQYIYIFFFLFHTKLQGRLHILYPSQIKWDYS